MADRELNPTRIEYLELLDERRVVHEGFELLDEKRMLLAARILRGLDELADRRDALQQAWRVVLEAMRVALAGHGLHELSVWPPRATRLKIQERSERVFGLSVISASASAEPGPPEWPSVAPAPSIDSCVAATREFLALAAAVAARETSLMRLVAEFTRTERRARAVENVLMPELEADLASVAAALEGLDQEEVVRVHGLRAADH